MVAVWLPDPSQAGTVAVAGIAVMVATHACGYGDFRGRLVDILKDDADQITAASLVDKNIGTAGLLPVGWGKGGEVKICFLPDIGKFNMVI